MVHLMKIIFFLPSKSHQSKHLPEVVEKHLRNCLESCFRYKSNQFKASSKRRKINCHKWVFWGKWGFIVFFWPHSKSPFIVNFNISQWCWVWQKSVYFREKNFNLMLVRHHSCHSNIVAPLHSCTCELRIFCPRRQVESIHCWSRCLWVCKRIGWQEKGNQEGFVPLGVREKPCKLTVDFICMG